MTPSKSKWLWGILIFLALVVVAAYGYFYFFVSRPIVLSESAPATPPQIGVPFTVTVQFTNTSKNDLKDIRLTLVLPDTSMPASGGGERVMEKDVQSLSSGQSAEAQFSVIALPQGSASSTPLDFKTTAYYSLASVTATFEKSAELNLPIADPGFGLGLLLPQSVYSGERFNLAAGYSNDGQSRISDLKLKLDYPAGMSEISASPARSADGSGWDLGNVPNGDSGKVSVTDEVNLPDGSSFGVTGELWGTVGSKDYLILTSSATSTVAVSPLSISVSSNTGAVVNPGTTLNYTLAYKNNTNTDFHNAVIRAVLKGGMFNFSNVATNGTLNGNTLTWTSANDNNLTLIPAGASGSETFSIGIDADYPAPNASDNNLEVSVNASIESPTVPFLINANSTKDFSSLTSKIADLPAISAKGYFRDAANGVLNTGPWPPKVSQATEYSVHWEITNYSDDLSNIVLKATLPPGVTFVRSVMANTSSTPSYDPSSNSVVWNVGGVSAWAGTLSLGPTAIFQVSATPESNMIGSPMEILGETDLTAQDGFTAGSAEATAQSLTTALPDDPTVRSGDGSVQN